MPIIGLIHNVRADTNTKFSTVPKKPNNAMKLRFLKKNLFLMLKPADMIIGGRR